MVAIRIAYDNVLAKMTGYGDTTAYSFTTRFLLLYFSYENMKTNVNIKVMTQTDYCLCEDSSWQN